MNSPLTPEDLKDLEAYLNETISPEDFERFQDRMGESPELRRAVRRYLALDENLRLEAESKISLLKNPEFTPWLESVNPDRQHSNVSFLSRYWPLAAAAVLTLAASIIFLKSPQEPATAQSSEKSESFSQAQGFAVIEYLSDAKWASNMNQFNEGDTVGAETLKLLSGTAEVHFFSGASMTIQGPAEVSLESSWKAICSEGSVRMRVPPAARGFQLDSPATKIVDLGTEFGLHVQDGRSQVEVFDGEIAVTHREEDEQILTEGKALELDFGGPSNLSAGGTVQFPNSLSVGPHANSRIQEGFERWQKYRNRLAKNPDLAAFYTFENRTKGNHFPNLVDSIDFDLVGAPILTEKTTGRWPGFKPALEFRKPGSRVRVNIASEFEAFTFSTWVRIDSLDRQYSALFMADGYENGEPHWQIHNDGRLMLSVMVDSSRPSIWPTDVSGYHYVYFSPRIWTPDMSGQWLHLTSVFNPKEGYAAHFVNGERVSGEKIKPEFQISNLRVGNAEIGNWGQPNRTDPNYAIRSINGRIGEMAIFNAALIPPQIKKLYENSRPLNH